MPEGTPHGQNGLRTSTFAQIALASVDIPLPLSLPYSQYVPPVLPFGGLE